MGYSIKVICLSCLIGWCYLYGWWLLLLEILLSSFPIPLCGALFLTIFVYLIRIPPPSAALIDEVLGKDLEIEADEDENVDNSREFPYQMSVVAHRACGFDAPENSMSAVRLVQERGCTAVELDVALTSDGVAVLYHDKTIQRMCNIEGRISLMTYDELQELDISVTHPLGHKFRGERIPRLDDAVEEAVSLGLRIFIDLKDNDTRLVGAMVDQFGKYPELARRAVISSCYPHIIFLVRRALPEVVCSLAWRPGLIAYEDYTYSRSVGGPYRRRFDSMWRHCVACIGDVVLQWTFHHLLYFLLGLSAVLVHKDTLSPERVRHWRKRGVRAIVWPVNLPAEKEYFARVLQVTYMTDTLDAEPE